MLLWLSANWGTVLVAALLAAAIAAVIRKLVRNKRAGRHACGCDCCSGSCAKCGQCHGG